MVILTCTTSRCTIGHQDAKASRKLREGVILVIVAYLRAC
jgi:hypothetical protein